MRRNKHAVIRVPKKAHTVLTAYAALEGRSVSDVVLEIVRAWALDVLRRRPLRVALPREYRRDWDGGWVEVSLWITPEHRHLWDAVRLASCITGTSISAAVSRRLEEWAEAHREEVDRRWAEALERLRDMMAAAR
jgi:hypothetical protein